MNASTTVSDHRRRFFQTGHNDTRGGSNGGHSVCFFHVLILIAPVLGASCASSSELASRTAVFPSPSGEQSIVLTERCNHSQGRWGAYDYRVEIQSRLMNGAEPEHRNALFTWSIREEDGLETEENPCRPRFFEKKMPRRPRGKSYLSNYKVVWLDDQLLMATGPVPDGYENNGAFYAGRTYQRLDNKIVSGFPVCLDTGDALLDAFDLSGPPRRGIDFETLSSRQTVGRPLVRGRIHNGVCTAVAQDDVTRQQVPDHLSPFTKIAMGADEYMACGLRENGALSCFGWVPGGSDTASSAPSRGFVDVSTSWGRTCGITSAAALECWGGKRNWSVDRPPDFTHPGPYTRVVVAKKVVCTLAPDRSLDCWRDEGRGREPVAHPAKKFSDIDGGKHAFCGLDARTGRPQCWGKGPLASLPAPALAFVEVNVGVDQACALSRDKRLTCWGPNAPKEVDAVDVRAFSVAEDRVCYIDGAGRLHAMGAPFFTESAAIPDDGHVLIACGYKLGWAIHGSGSAYYDLDNDQQPSSTFSLARPMQRSRKVGAGLD